MFWLYLLGAVTVLSIALRRVIHRQTPLSDELYSTKAAFDHLQSGVAWVRADGTVGKVNSSLTSTLSTTLNGLVGCDWLSIFAELDRDRVQESYTRMLLLGKTEIDAYGQRADGTYAWLNVLLVAIHDHRARFVGHHCLILDSTHSRMLENRVKELERDSFSVAAR